MHRVRRLLPLFICALCAEQLLAQMPFYTDNADVTDAGTLHFEFYNEFDGLQTAQFPDLRQNTVNLSLSYGLPHGLEFDFDFPYVSTYRAQGSQTSSGVGDIDMGIKWNFRKSAHPMSFPALSASLYIQFPTGDANQGLGTGLTQYWINSIAEEPLSEKTRINANFGFLFAGSTSTGDQGAQTTRGHVYTGGISLLHDFNPRVTLGIEVFNAVADDKGLARDQLQGLAGGQYNLNSRCAVTFALLSGSHIASPRIGGQIGFQVDFPLRRAPPKQAPSDELTSPNQRKSQDYSSLGNYVRVSD